VTLNEGTFSAASSPPHSHPTLGGTFFEPLGDLHTTHGAAAPNDGVRFLTFRMVPKAGR
jgi:hypothetical protein